jgi:hypothetical protein
MADEPKLITQESLSIIIQKLTEKGISGQCPVCINGVFQVSDGFLTVPCTKDLAHAIEVIGEKTFFPCVGLVCNNCAFTRFHSLGALGLLHLFDKKERENE